MVKALTTLQKKNHHEHKSTESSTNPRLTLGSRQIVLLLLNVFGLGIVAFYLLTSQDGTKMFADTTKAFNRVLDMSSALAANATRSSRVDATITTTAAPTETPTEEEEEVQLTIPVANMSVFRYSACCGLGHRLDRMGAAYHAAHLLGFRLEVEWPNCGVNLYNTLFDPESNAELAYVNSTGELFFASNEVHGYTNADFNRIMIPDEFQAYHDMIFSMVRRYKYRDEVNKYVQENFKGKLSVGIHIRAGNGEKGDFESKQRGVASGPQNYTNRATQFIRRMVQNANSTLPAVLFVATDTAEYVDLFRTALDGFMEVLEWNQTREAPGEGVFMGHQEKRLDNHECVNKWRAMLADSMLLGKTDVMIAGQYSSFNQAIPMFLALGQDEKTRKFPKPFCEFYQDAHEMLCFSDTMDWNMNSRNLNSLKSRNVPRGEFVHWKNTMESMEDEFYWKDKRKGPKSLQERLDEEAKNANYQTNAQPATWKWED